MPMSTITVAGINPGLNVLGNAQQFNYTQPLSLLQLTNSFVPTISVPSQFNQEVRNNAFSGFRWVHLTTSADTHGSLTLQSFVNAQSTGVDLITFSESGTINIAALFGANVNMNNYKIINLLDPTFAQDGATKNYVDTKTASAVGVVGTMAALYISTSLPTILGSTLFTKVNGATTATFLKSGFSSPDPNKILYSGTNAIDTIVSVTLTAKPVAAESTIGISIFKNGSNIEHIVNYAFQLTAGMATPISASVYAKLETNDYIEVFINNDLSSNTTVTDMSLTIVA